jgi:hypothetical protein
MIEYFPEPEEAKADSWCANCGKALFVGDTIVDDNGHICEGCMTEWALKKAKCDVLIEFITSCNHENEFTQWYYGDNIRTLEIEEGF